MDYGHKKAIFKKGRGGDSWSPVSEGFVGDPWLSITLTLCHILHSVSHWPVLVYFIKKGGVPLEVTSHCAVSATGPFSNKGDSVCTTIQQPKQCVGAGVLPKPASPAPLPSGGL
jgi:hypothetical protein